MQAIITRDKWKFNSPYPIIEISEMIISNELNGHASLWAKGTLNCGPDEIEEIRNGSNAGDEVSVVVEEGGETLFLGFPDNIKLSVVRDVRYIEIKCLSATSAMDIADKSRSFQHKDMLYDELLKEVSSGYDDGDFLNMATPGEKTGRVIMQYRETDWAFLKRLAAYERTALACDSTSAKPRFWFGLPNASRKISLDEDALRRTYVKKISAAESDGETEKLFYEIELDEILRIGDEVSIGQKPLIVVKYKITIERSALVFRYRLEDRASVKRKPYDNDAIKGVALGGSVIDVKLNHIKVHLDIDEKQDVGKATWYPVAAEANNVWYAMPHKGERVNLHLTDSGESAVIITATRGSDGEMAKTKSMSKPTEKYMETKWNKKLALHEGNIELDIPTVNISFDEESVAVVSNDKIIFETKTDINLGKTKFGANAQGSGVEETKKITLTAEELVTLQVTNKNSVIELDENNTIHSFLDNVLMEGSNKAPMPMLVSQGQEAGQAAKEAEEQAEAERQAAEEAAAEEEEKGGFWGRALNVAVGVAKVALSVTAVVAGAALIVGTGGLAAVAIGVVGEGRRRGAEIDPRR